MKIFKILAKSGQSYRVYFLCTLSDLKENPTDWLVTANIQSPVSPPLLRAWRTEHIPITAQHPALHFVFCLEVWNISPLGRQGIPGLHCNSTVCGNDWKSPRVFLLDLFGYNPGSLCWCRKHLWACHCHRKSVADGQIRVARHNRLKWRQISIL